MRTTFSDRMTEEVARVVGDILNDCRKREVSPGILICALAEALAYSARECALMSPPERRGDIYGVFVLAEKMAREDVLVIGEDEVRTGERDARERAELIKALSAEVNEQDRHITWIEKRRERLAAALWEIARAEYAGASFVARSALARDEKEEEKRDDIKSADD